jgi:hypothetical protein
MTTAITPEVLGLETQVLEDSPMSDAEQRKLIELETKIKTKLGSKMEADLAIGGALLQIQRERLYRGPDGGRKFEDYIKEESGRLSTDGRAIGVDTAEYLRGFYYFREEVLSGAPGPGRGGQSLPLPTTAKQVRPLLFLLDHLRRAADSIDTRRGKATYEDRRAAEAKAIDIWKAACSQAGNGKVPTFDQVNSARLADAAAELHRLRGNPSTRPPSSSAPPVQPCPPARPSLPAERLDNEATWPSDMKRDAYGIHMPDEPAGIPAWEMEKDDSALDAATECRRVSQLLRQAQSSISTLRGDLYNQINKYGRDYLGFLRQVDAGVYSLGDIDDRVHQMGEDIDFIASLLVADVGEGELARSTVEATAFPTRA